MFGLRLSRIASVGVVWLAPFAPLAPLAACGSRAELPIDSQGTIRASGGSAGTTGTSDPGGPPVCVFDYDLTLSSHDCAKLEGRPEYFCRINTCDTYGWFSQCLGERARAAVAECVRRNAYIGIASHAGVDACWNDKVTPILTEGQFPEFTLSPAYGRRDAALSYPRLEDRANWNCENCAYTMDGGLSKPNGIARVMRHYGLNPRSADDRRRVIFWDDTPSNITDVNEAMPEVRAILVQRFTDSGADGGCGITREDIDAGFAP